MRLENELIQWASQMAVFCLGLDAVNLAEAFSAGNAVVPKVAEWIARSLMEAG